MAPLLKGAEFGGLLRSSAPSEIADKAFDAEWIIVDPTGCEAKIINSQRPKRKAPLAIDLYVQERPPP